MAEVRPITRPLNLRRYLQEPSRGFDFVPFLDLCVIGLFFALHSSRFLFAPGMAVELPRLEASAIDAVPTAAVLTVLPAPPEPDMGEDEGGSVEVLKQKRRNLVLFQGEMFGVEILERKLSDYLSTREDPEAVLLVKAGRQVSLGELADVFRSARLAGFERVQLAAEEATVREDIFAPTR